ncbi:hypothetical protein BCR35DRAFT_218859 [Leucosporidium creatinivorum]|uniref:LYC1 C-terminal domain-containing protein n=1 Tax=Leucosporidium creatinivorum TaxID=106004 RepID=A0A1Y2FX85_9BASI|nr:hypothetical protein BCR35DRAFT_218859 [Leucosporidium creatinivorum]
MTVEHVVLRRATEAQFNQGVVNQLEQWGGGLSLPLFQQREELLKATGMGQELTGWVLLPSSAPADTLDFLCSVRTYRRPIYYLPGSSSASPHPSAPSSTSAEPSAATSGTPTARRVTAYSVATVFTPAKNRGKGYAQKMMELLHAELRTKGDGAELLQDDEEKDGKPLEAWKGGKDGLLSFLLSDVGHFYARAKDERSGRGWRVQGTTTTTWNLAESLQTSPESFSTPPTPPSGFHTSPITSTDLASVALADAALLHTSLSASVPSSKPRFIVEPTPSSFEWSTTRSTHAFAARGLPVPSLWGFQLRGEAEGGRAAEDGWSYILLVMDPKLKVAKLLRLRLASTSAKELVAGHASYLVRAAAELARSHGMEQMLGWNVPSAALEELEEGDKGVTAEREGNLSAVAWYGEGDGEVEWENNESYTWC